MLVVEHLVKQYGELTAVDDVSFEAQAGKVFGLLGPHGAGKSTTINCISGLLTPTTGHIAVSGHDIARDGKAARRSLGVRLGMAEKSRWAMPRLRSCSSCDK